jgi:hypothetical protein
MRLLVRFFTLARPWAIALPLVAAAFSAVERIRVDPLGPR